MALEWLMPARYTSGRFVGRERELARLAVALDQAAGGRSTTLLVAGTGGLGASRLLTETERRLAALSEPFTVIRGRPTAAERASPYGPIVAGLAPILAALTDAELATVVGTGGAELVRLFPALEPRLADAGMDGGPRQVIAPERRQARVLERFVGLLASLGERRPVLLVMEDLHGVDAATRALVTFLARLSRPQRLVVVGTYQPAEMTRGPPFHADLAPMAAPPRPAGRLDPGPPGRAEPADLVAGIEGERPSASVLLP